MPEWQTTRIQMDRCPVDCVGDSIGANVVFIFNSDNKHHLPMFVKNLATQRGQSKPLAKKSDGENCVVEFSGAMLE